MYQKALDHPGYDAFWKSMSVRERSASIRVPVFSVGGWYDNFVESDLEAFAAVAENWAAQARLVIGPWPHNMSVPISRAWISARKSTIPLRKLQLEWFDYWLKTRAGQNGSLPPARCASS